MHFCVNCQNMYYVRLDAENPNKLVYYCNKCGTEDKSIIDENVIICKTQIKKSEQSFNHIINKYTKLDPTLPRISNILCPNPECPTNKSGEKREIIYIRYDDTNMRYVYLCSSRDCNTIWKTDEQK